jgi:hypothetical protein
MKLLITFLLLIGSAAAQANITDGNFSEEWIEVSNNGQENLSLDGWTLSDAQNHTYAFQDFNLSAAARVHTGQGNDTGSDLYWGRKRPVWNNEGDFATLKDETGRIISTWPKEA